MIRRHLALALAACALLLPAASLATPPTAPTYTTPSGAKGVAQPVVIQQWSGDQPVDASHGLQVDCVAGCASGNSEANAGSDASKATAVQGITGGKAIAVSDGGGSLTVDGSVGISGTLPSFASTPTVNNVPGGVADGQQTTITLTSTTPSAAFDMRYADFGVMQFTGVGSGNTIQVQCSNDGTPGTGSSFAPAPIQYYGGSPISPVISLVSPSASTLYVFPALGSACRVAATVYGSGTITVYVTRKRGMLPVPSQQAINTAGNGPNIQGPGTAGAPTGGVLSTQPALAGLTPAPTSAASGSLVVKASAGKLYSAGITTGGSAGYLLIYNATSAPADGAVTPQACIQVDANKTWMGDFVTAGIPETYTTGIVMVFSTTGCFTQTSSSTAFLRAKYQ